MKKIIIILSIFGLSCSKLVCQYGPTIPNINIPTNTGFNNDDFNLSLFDPLRGYINSLDIDAVISELTKDGNVDEYRRSRALNYLAAEIKYWQNASSSIFKSPDMLIALSGIVLGITGLVCLHNHKAYQAVKNIRSFNQYRFRLPGDRNCKHWDCKYSSRSYYDRQRHYPCDDCRIFDSAKFYRDMSDFESNVYWGLGLSLPVVGYLLYKFSKKCPFANMKLKKLQNIEYFVKLLSDK